MGSTVNSLIGSASSAIAAGNFAGNLATTATGGLGSIAGAVGAANSMSIGVSAVTGLVDSAKGVSASAFSAITSSFKALKAGVPQNLTAIATKNATESVASEVSGSLSAIPVPSLSGVSSIAGSLPAGQVGAIATSVSGAVGKITSSVSATVAGASSGVNALPGGLGAVSSVVDNAKGAINIIPGTAAISGAIGNSTSAVTNGLSAVPGALSKLGAPASLTAGLNTLKAGAGTLSALASTGLSPSASAKMNAAIASLSSGGSVPIKLPVVAVNTTDRGELSAGLSAVFGSTKIAAPNFGGNPATFGTSQSTESIKKYEETKALIATTYDAFLDQRKVSWDAQAAYDKAKNELPQGDPQIEQLKATWIAEATKATELEKKVQMLRDQRQSQ